MTRDLARRNDYVRWHWTLITVAQNFGMIAGVTGFRAKHS